MADLLPTRLRKAWNIIINNEHKEYEYIPGESYYSRPDRVRLSTRTDKTIVNSIINRIANDAAAITIKHVRLDEGGRYIEDIDSGLNNCLTLEANLDQSARSFIRDIVISMLDDGVVAVVPIDTEDDPDNGFKSMDILTLRTAKILEWKPYFVKIKVYDDRNGKKKELWVPKQQCAILENPFYSMFNERNSTTQRLTRKLSLLDVTDERTASNKLDLIVQLPYVIKTKTMKDKADERRRDLEDQLTNSKYGIAYMDGSEKIVQLNRSLENNLMKQVEYLTNLLMGQLGITQAVLDGTADDKVMLNYYNRTVEPIVSTIVDEFKRKFLTKTARTQRQTIMCFRDPFKLVPVNELAEITDKLTRNEIATSNEMRQIMGWKPSDDPNADVLRNKNIADPNADEPPQMDGQYYEEEGY